MTEVLFHLYVVSPARVTYSSNLMPLIAPLSVCFRIFPLPPQPLDSTPHRPRRPLGLSPSQNGFSLAESIRYLGPVYCVWLSFLFFVLGNGQVLPFSCLCCCMDSRGAGQLACDTYLNGASLECSILFSWPEVWVQSQLKFSKVTFSTTRITRIRIFSIRIIPLPWPCGLFVPAKESCTSK